jgi:hypothetical protein
MEQGREHRDDNLFKSNRQHDVKLKPCCQKKIQQIQRLLNQGFANHFAEE